jgi:hypothetical protein
MPFKDPKRAQEYQRDYHAKHPRPNRGETHTTRPGYVSKRDRFVAIDGEGYNLSDRQHAYAWLAASDGKRTVHVFNPSGLDHRACDEFLLSLPTEFGPSIFVAFGMGYDTEFWIPTRRSTLEYLDRTGRCLDGPYRYLLWPRKRFEIARIRDSHDQPVKGPMVTVDDVFSNFSSSFEEAVNKWDITFPKSDAEILHQGKKKRGRFTLHDFDSGFVERYNAVELRLLVELVRALRHARENVGIVTSSYYSPANLSTVLFRRYGVKIEPPKPGLEEHVWKASYAAYFGGRIECAAYGTYIGKVWEYDVNRAYPWAMSTLPNFGRGSSDSDSSYRPGSRWSLYHLRWDFTDLNLRFNPFPWRDTGGAVYYPPRGTGWAWAPEVRAEFVRTGRVEILDAFHFTPTESDARPFSWQEEVYRQQQRFAQKSLSEGRPNPDYNLGAALVLKLGQNSAYGKLAQRVSAQTEPGPDGLRVRVRPRFHNPIYAGLITSIGRSRLWDLIHEVNELEEFGNDDLGVIALATDAVFTSRPLWSHAIEDGEPPLPGRRILGATEFGSRFGAVKIDEFHKMQSLQSGVYRLFGGKEPVVRGRGFGDRKVPWDKIESGWRNCLASITFHLERFIGHRWARAQSKFAPRSWVKVPRTITLGAVGKRRLDPPPHYTRRRNPATRLYWTMPIDDVDYYAESAPNLPDFTLGQGRTPSDTAEDLRDMGWEEEPYED